MLDSENLTKETATETPEAPEGEAEAAAPETPEAEAPEIVIAIEGEEPEADPDAEAEAELGDAGKRALKAARESQKETARKLRAAEARLADYETAAQPKMAEIERPTLEECGFNEDAYAERMGEYLAAEGKRKAELAAEAERKKAAEAAYNAKLDGYNAARAGMGIDDEAEAAVVGRLNVQQQSVLMDAAGDPAKVVAALARTPKVLEELSGIKELHRFAYRLAQIEGKITMTTKTPPPPESKVRGGGTPAGAISGVSLDKLQAHAEETGDYTAYLAEKRRRAAAGVKT